MFTLSANDEITILHANEDVAEWTDDERVTKPWAFNYLSSEYQQLKAICWRPRTTSWEFGEVYAIPVRVDIIEYIKRGNCFTSQWDFALNYKYESVTTDAKAKQGIHFVSRGGCQKQNQWQLGGLLSFWKREEGNHKLRWYRIRNHELNENEN